MSRPEEIVKNSSKGTPTPTVRSNLPAIGIDSVALLEAPVWQGMLPAGEILWETPGEQVQYFIISFQLAACLGWYFCVLFKTLKKVY